MVALRLEKKLLKIMNMIFSKGKVPNDFRIILVKPLYEKGDKSEFHNYRGIDSEFKVWGPLFGLNLSLIFGKGLSSLPDI